MPAKRIPISERIQKILCCRSGGICAFPGCNRELVEPCTEKDEESFVGILAHINSYSPGHPRHNLNMTTEEVNSASNIILLCPTHHKIVDDQTNTYTVEDLMKMKQDHESKIANKRGERVKDVSYAELDVVIKYLVSGEFSDSIDFSSISITEKIVKNKLSQAVQQHIKYGMLKMPLIKKFIEQNPDKKFGERLANPIAKEFRKLLKEEPMTGDELYYSMLSFVNNGIDKDHLHNAAALTVLNYFIELCDVLEK